MCVFITGKCDKGLPYMTFAKFSDLSPPAPPYVQILLPVCLHIWGIFDPSPLMCGRHIRQPSYGFPNFPEFPENMDKGRGECMHEGWNEKHMNVAQLLRSLHLWIKGCVKSCAFLLRRRAFFSSPSACVLARRRTFLSTNSSTSVCNLVGGNL